MSTKRTQEKKFLLIIVAIFVIGLGFFLQSKHQPPQALAKPSPLPTQTPSPTPKVKVKYPVDLTIVMVGDSMTENLGNYTELRTDLKKYYPGKTVEVLNYGFGSTNILSLQDRLEKKTFYGREFRPIDDIDFNVIIIESFGNNPLSQYPLDEGLKKQTEALDLAISTIKNSNPNAKILFLATIAPVGSKYGLGVVKLSTDQRYQWAAERRAYIENHINYAQKHNIGLIDVYHPSMTNSGQGNEIYVSKTDYIHPSPTGIIFISQIIADYLGKNL
jgi:lysophospholipase L1-like esterase